MCGGSDKPKQTPEEKALGEIAVQKWNDYQSRFRPVEDQFIKDVQKTESDYSQAKGRANTAVEQSFGEAEQVMKNQSFQQGIAPDSGSFIKDMDNIAIDKGIAKGDALNEAHMAVDNAHVNGLQTVVAMGQGQSIDAMQGMTDIASDATNKAIDRAYTSVNERNAGLQLAGQLAGAGTSYYMNNSGGDQ